MKTLSVHHLDFLNLQLSYLMNSLTEYSQQVASYDSAFVHSVTHSLRHHPQFFPEKPNLTFQPSVLICQPHTQVEPP